MSWFWVATIVAFGQHHLNRSNHWISKLNQGLYPFYILHQTVIITLGYYVCQLPLGIAAKFWSISALTLLICVVAYLGIIKPLKFARLVFGIGEPKKIEHKVYVHPTTIGT
jgi:peptidoglycan/LPS O-acetylase OafA/YrhL